jgi:hypothetical protein
MGIREVRSPWSRDRREAHPRLAESPGSRSSPSNRTDAHLAGHLGKSASQPASARRNSVPVVGNEFGKPSDYLNGP